jgi:hypothetical protein
MLYSMNDTQILVLGAGELGMAVLRSLAKHLALHSGTTLTVLLRPSTIASDSPSKQQEIALDVRDPLRSQDRMEWVIAHFPSI